MGGGKKGNMKRKFGNQKAVAKKFRIRNDQQKINRKKSKAGTFLTGRVKTNKKEKLQVLSHRKNKRAEIKGRNNKKKEGERNKEKSTRKEEK